VATEYLVPCQCGQTVPVQTRQAGQTVHCACGRTLVVPTIRELSRLEQRQGAPDVSAAPWSTRSAMLSLGLLITLLGVGLTGYLYWKMPRIDPVAKGREVENMSPYETWQWWRYYNSGIPRYPTDEFMVAKGREIYLTRWSYFTIGIGLIGLLILLVGLVMPGTNVRGQRRTSPSKS
jgi:hypothetical protein